MRYIKSLRIEKKRREHSELDFFRFSAIRILKKYEVLGRKF